MKPAFLSLLLAPTLLAAAPPPAAPPSAAPPSAGATPPVFGRWAVDVTKVPVPAQFRPRSVTIAFADAGAGRGSMTVDIVDADGSQRHMASSYALDGTPTAIDGNTMEADTAAVTMPRPDVMVVNLSRAGTPGSTRIYTVAPNGRSMVETAASWDEQGKPRFRTNWLTRLP